jgi:TolB protein
VKRAAFAGVASIALALALTASSAYAAFPGANGKIAFDNGGTIYEINPDGSGLAALAPGMAPRWSPSGTRIAFTRLSGGQWSIWTMDSSGQNQRLVGPGLFASWSPDGRHLVYAAFDSDNRTAIYIANADGSNPKQITTPHCCVPPVSDSRPAWSPDGRRIAFVRGISDTAGLMVVNTDGTGLTALAFQVNSSPDWSPNASQIAAFVDPCFGECPDRTGLYLIQPQGTFPGNAQFTGVPGSSLQNAAWSPDGTTIAYQDVNGDLALFALSPRTTSRIADPFGNPVVGADPSWQPVIPHSLRDCKNNGWRAFGQFKNQGDCVKFVRAGANG